MKKLFLILIFLFLFCFNASAELEEYAQNTIYELDAYSEEFNFYEFYENILSGGELPAGLNLLSSVSDLFFKELKTAFKSLGFLMLPVFLFGILRFAGDEKGSLSHSAFIGCLAFMCAVITGIFKEMTTLVTDTAATLDIMTKGLVPLLFSILAYMGNLTQATLVQPFVLLVSEIISIILKSYIIPLIFIAFALSLTESITGMSGLKYFGDFIFKIIKWVMVFLVVFFLAFLSAQSIAANSADGMAVKGTKFAVSNFIPVVGGAMADGVETLGSSMQVIKNATGITGVFGVIYICVLPLIKIYGVSFLFHFMAALSFPVSDKRFGDVLSSAGSAMSLLGGVILSMAFVFIVTSAVVIATNPLFGV